MEDRNRQPLVSVIMAIRNGERYMWEAINSILGQTYTNFELILIDDASTDSTGKIIRNYHIRYSEKTKVITLIKQYGAFGAANLALKHARGEFIAPMDSDDIAHPQRLEKEVEFLQKNPDVIVVGSQAYLINENGELIGEKIFPTDNKGIYQAFAKVHAIVHPSCMIRRSMLPDKNRLYRDIYGVNDDYFTFFTLFKRGKFVNLPEKLLAYRLHGNNSSLQNLKDKFFNTFRIRLRAVLRHGYRPRAYDAGVVLTQATIAFFIPQRFFYPLYLFSKGVYPPRRLASKLYFTVRRPLAYSFSRLSLLPMHILALATKIYGQKVN